MLFVVCAFLFLADHASAEYRAFELHIVDTKTQESRTVISTLDPLQFGQYYTVHPDEKVSYTTTWMCRGNTAEKPICPNPKDSPPPTEPRLDQSVGSTPPNN